MDSFGYDAAAGVIFDGARDTYACEVEGVAASLDMNSLRGV